MDFPGAVPLLPVISSASVYAIGSSARGISATTPSSSSWPAANRALYIPFMVPASYLVRALWWANGSSVTGNVDCGIYSQYDVLLTNTGSTVQAGTSAVQSVTLGTPLLLTPGSYNMALVLSSASGTTFRTAPSFGTSLCGVTQMATTIPLPATFVPATVASQYIPLFGIASRTSPL